LIYTVDHGYPSSEDKDADGNISLSRFLTKRINKSKPLNDIGSTLSENRTDFILFCGLSKKHTLKGHERLCIEDFYLDEHAAQNFNRDLDDTQLHEKANSYNIPKHCYIFRSAAFDTRQRGNSYSFNSYSSAYNKSNLNQYCPTSYVRFELMNQRLGRNESHFGEVVFYFIIELRMIWL
jgi:hypothetical protein